MSDGGWRESVCRWDSVAGSQGEVTARLVGAELRPQRVRPQHPRHLRVHRPRELPQLRHCAACGVAPGARRHLHRQERARSEFFDELRELGGDALVHFEELRGARAVDVGEAEAGNAEASGLQGVEDEAGLASEEGVRLDEAEGGGAVGAAGGARAAGAEEEAELAGGGGCGVAPVAGVVGAVCAEEGPEATGGLGARPRRVGGAEERPPPLHSPVCH